MKDELIDPNVVKMLEASHRFRSSEAMSNLRKFLDSMDPEDCSNVIRSINEFLEAEDNPEHFMRVLVGFNEHLESLIEQITLRNGDQ